jgi:hypothetical protein
MSMAAAATLAVGVGGAAMSAGSSSAARKSAEKLNNAALANQQYEFKKNRELGELQLAIGQQRDERVYDEYDRWLQQTDFNRMEKAGERQFEIDQLNEYKRRLADERNFQVARQVESDRDQARQRLEALEERTRAQGISKEERDFAIEQFKHAQSIASGERDEELKRFYEDRFSKQQERDQQLAEGEWAKQQALREREYDIARYGDVYGRVDTMQRALEDAYSALGAAPELQQLTMGDFDKEYQGRASEYASDIDRAAQMVASQGEAGRMTRGMDASTLANDEKVELTRQLSDKYTESRRKAYDDAVKYISGKSQAMGTNYDNIFKNRGLRLDEIAGVQGAGLDTLRALRAPSSAVDAARYTTGAGTGILDRDITSANNYRAPITLDSVLNNYTQAGLGSNLGGYRVSNNTSTTEGMNSIGSAIINAIQGNLPASDAMYSNAGTMSNKRMDLWNANADKARGELYAANEAEGNAQRKLYDVLGPYAIAGATKLGSALGLGSSSTPSLNQPSSDQVWNGMGSGGGGLDLGNMSFGDSFTNFGNLDW